MTQFAVFLLSAVLLVGPAAPPSKAGAGEMIDNPEYANWAQFKVGSFATVKHTSLMGEHKSVSLNTQTLKSVAKDKIVVEMRIEIEGLKQQIPPQTREIPAKIAKAAEPKTPTTQPKDMPDVKAKEGDEVIEIDGRKIKTHWIESRTNMGEMITQSKVWNSEDVPGMIVKLTARTEGVIQSTTESVLTKMKAEKK